MPAAPPQYVAGHKLLEGKTAVVTAAAGTGIGYAVARRCAEEGAQVLISDIHERRLAEAAARMEEQTGFRPPTVLCNVTDEAEVQNLIDTAIAEFGHIDVLMN
ncbi:MAG: SDR family oxidoreductase, partial [Acidimicrobiales bacterium]|nr:SDR family oxidoreductase [Acidimicrobiales bacterium]